MNREKKGVTTVRRDKEQCILSAEKCNNIHKTGITFQNSGDGVLKSPNSIDERIYETVGELNNQLNAICQGTDTNRSGLDILISYYQKSLDWTEEASLRYAIELFKNGTIDQIKVLGKDGEVL